MSVFLVVIKDDKQIQIHDIYDSIEKATYVANNIEKSTHWKTEIKEWKIK